MFRLHLAQPPLEPLGTYLVSSCAFTRPAAETRRFGTFSIYGMSTACLPPTPGMPVYRLAPGHQQVTAVVTSTSRG